MVSKERVLEMMREGIRIEERAVLLALDSEMRELRELQISAAAYDFIQERLDRLRKDTIEHEESFKRANAALQSEAGNDY